MINTVEVFLWKKRIGILHQGDDSEYASFEYDRAFQSSGIELSPFKMPLGNKLFSFPELSRSDAFHGLPGLVADSLPDKFGNAVINSWLLNHGKSINSFTALDRLCYTGTRGMGALEYHPATELSSLSHEGRIDVTEMTRLVSSILSQRESLSYNNSDIGKAQLLEIGSSAGGARAKAVIAWNEKTNEVRSGQTDAGEGFEHWLIKFDGVSNNGDHEIADPRQYTLIEYIYYLLAKELGIDMEECRLMKKDGLCHFMTKRFDRANGNKLHMQTLAALCHYDYNVPHLCSYEEYAEKAKQLGIGKSGIEQIYRRMVFSVLGLNCDDHVKNFTFIMEREGKWSLSPAYDITFAYKPENKWISSHQMTVNGKSFDITKADLITCGKTMGLYSSACRKIIEHTALTLEKWLTLSQNEGLAEERALYIDKLLRDNVQRCLMG